MVSRANATLVASVAILIAAGSAAADSVTSPIAAHLNAPAVRVLISLRCTLPPPSPAEGRKFAPKEGDYGGAGASVINTGSAPAPAGTPVELRAFDPLPGFRPASRQIRLTLPTVLAPNDVWTAPGQFGRGYRNCTALAR